MTQSHVDDRVCASESALERWTYAVHNPKVEDPRILLADELARHGCAVEFREAKRGRNTVAIFASAEARTVLQTAAATPAFDALVLARSGRLDAPDVTRTTWDDETKARVRALFWQRKVEDIEARLRKCSAYETLYQDSGNHEALAETKRSMEELAQELNRAQAKLNRVLGERSPLREPEWQQLVRQIVRDSLPVQAG